MTKDMKKMNTMGSLSNNDQYVDQNIFAQQAQIEMANLAPDRERPRANLYNVIKRLRENSVSVIFLPLKTTIFVTPFIFFRWATATLSLCPS